MFFLVTADGGVTKALKGGSLKVFDERNSQLRLLHGYHALQWGTRPCSFFRGRSRRPRSMNRTKWQIPQIEEEPKVNVGVAPNVKAALLKMFFSDGAYTRAEFYRDFPGRN